MSHIDKPVQLELHYNEAQHRKYPMNGVRGAINRVLFGFCEIKQNHNKHSGRIRNRGFKDCTVHSINLPFPR